MHFSRCFVTTTVVFAVTAIALPVPDDFSYDLSAREDYDSGHFARSYEDLDIRDDFGGELYYPRDYDDLEARAYEISHLNSRDQNPPIFSRSMPNLVHIFRRGNEHRKRKPKFSPTVEQHHIAGPSNPSHPQKKAKSFDQEGSSPWPSSSDPQQGHILPKPSRQSSSHQSSRQSSLSVVIPPYSGTGLEPPVIAVQSPGNMTPKTPGGLQSGTVYNAKTNEQQYQPKTPISITPGPYPRTPEQRHGS